MTKNTIRTNTTSRLLIGSALALTAFAAIPNTTHAYILTRQLEFGMSGADVTAVQSYLAQDRTIYAEGRVTGFFGPLTRTAVANFQACNEIPSVGRIGPMTLPILNARMNGSVYTTDPASLISNVSVNQGKNSAHVAWNNNESVKGVVYYSTAQLTVTELPHSVVISGNSSMTDGQFRSSHNVTLANLEANTTYYYMIHTVDESGNVTVTMPASFKTNSN